MYGFFGFKELFRSLDLFIMTLCNSLAHASFAQIYFLFYRDMFVKFAEDCILETEEVLKLNLQISALKHSLSKSLWCR